MYKAFLSNLHRRQSPSETLTDVKTPYPFRNMKGNHALAAFKSRCKVYKNTFWCISLKM